MYTLGFTKFSRMKLGDLAGHRFTRGAVQCESIPPGTYARRRSRGWVPSKGRLFVAESMHLTTKREKEKLYE